MDRVLPEELLVRIFSLLADDRKDISACRLVCSTFTRCSTQFLITRVVYANRLDAIERLCDVLGHENDQIRNGITELVYDSSAYDEFNTSSIRLYRRACEETTGRNFEDIQTRRLDDRYLKVRNRVSTTSSDWDLDLYMSDMDNLSFLGGFADYCEKYLDQERMDSDCMRDDILSKIFRRCKGLRRVLFTDFRALAAPEETYEQLCDRLFGETLEPLFSMADTSCDLDNMLSCIPMFHRHRIQQLWIGSHQFEDWNKSIMAGPLGLPANSAALRATAISIWESRERSGDICTLRDIRLPVEVTDYRYGVLTQVGLEAEVKESLACSLLTGSAGSLTRISLLCLGVIESMEDRTAKSLGGDKWQYLEMLLFPLTFPSLQHLHLRTWALPSSNKCEEFFSRHSRSLRQLRLEDCSIFEDPCDLARWAGINLHLDGVQIRLLTVAEDGEQAECPACGYEELEALWLGGRPNRLLTG